MKKKRTWDCIKKNVNAEFKSAQRRGAQEYEGMGNSGVGLVLGNVFLL